MLDLNLNYMLKAVNLEAKSALNERHLNCSAV